MMIILFLVGCSAIDTAQNLLRELQRIHIHDTEQEAKECSKEQIQQKNTEDCYINIQPKPEQMYAKYLKMHVDTTQYEL